MMAVLDRRQILSMGGLAALGACADRSALFITDSDAMGPERQVIMATNRIETEGLPARSEDVRYSKLTIATQSGRKVGQLDFTGRDAFALRDEDPLEISDLSKALADVSLDTIRPIDPLVLWVHGFNNLPGEAVARQVQILQDVGARGPAVSFVWPSEGAPTGYVFDRDSALASRNALQQVLTTLRAAWSGPILILAHSLGGFLVMETLARMRRSGTSGPIAEGLVLIQPDIDPQVFRQQVAAALPLPERSVLMISQRDPALRLSSFISHQPARLGMVNDVATYAEYGLEIQDLTEIADAYDPHLVAFTSPTALAGLRTVVAEERGLRR